MTALQLGIACKQCIRFSWKNLEGPCSALYPIGWLGPEEWCRPIPELEKGQLRLGDHASVSARMHLPQEAAVFFNALCFSGYTSCYVAVVGDLVVTI